jgi:hypothetical protein
MLELLSGLKFRAKVAGVLSCMLAITSLTVIASSEPAGADSLCTSVTSLASCVLAASSSFGGTQGMVLQQDGGPLIASSNESFLYEPASSIKPLIALYALNLVQQGLLRLTDQIPKIDTSGGPGDCPPSNITGSEDVGTAIQQMLQVSDNNRTRELMQVFGLTNLNSFAASLGLTATVFQTSGSPPGFNVIGCGSYPSPVPTMDGNTMSLTDAATMWQAIEALPAPYADLFHQLAAGRDMYNSTGSDFTLAWPGLTMVAYTLAPSFGVTGSSLHSFINRLSLSYKPGKYDWTDCSPGCQFLRWRSFAGVLQVPSCTGSTYTPTTYEAGLFMNRAVLPSAALSAVDSAFFTDALNLMAEPVATGLASWNQCAPSTRTRLHATGPTTLTTSGEVEIDTSLAAVTDTDLTDVAQDMSGVVNWGDGTTSPTTVSGSNGHFSVHSWHTYASAGRYKAIVTVQNVGSGRIAKHKIKVTVT